LPRDASDCKIRPRLGVGKGLQQKHFEFNAEQRLKAFNFFVVFFGFANGGIFTAVGKDSHPVVFLLLGFFVCLLSVVFYVIDARSRNLLEMTKPGLINYESALPAEARVFTLDDRNRSRLISYTFAFRTLFGVQFLFGLGVIVYGLVFR
jgi:hypothetical protein